MIVYFVRRFLINILLLFLVTFIVYSLANLAPGSPVDYFINPDIGMSDQQIQQIKKSMGLDQPMLVRYAKWLDQVVHGNLGYRYVNGDAVLSDIWSAFKNTLELISAAFVLGSVLGVFLGVFSALHQYSFWDFALTGLSFIGISMPAFVAGILGLYFFAVIWKVFPAGGMETVGQRTTLIDSLYHLALPALILSLGYIATFMRYTRFSVLEVVRQDFVQVARAKGLKERVVITRHILRNAILPVVTIFGLSIPNLFIGAVFIETIFSWPGMGTLYLNAVTSSDYPLIMGINLFAAVFILLSNMLTDWLYAVVDPRIRYQ